MILALLFNIGIEMSNQAVEIEILGKLTRVNCPAGQEQALRQAAKELDKRLNEMTKRTQVTNVEKLLTITALNACYELQQVQQTQLSTLDNYEAKVAQLSEQLDSSLTRVTQHKPTE